MNGHRKLLTLLATPARPISRRIPFLNRFGRKDKSNQLPEKQPNIKTIEHGPTKLIIITSPATLEVEYLKTNFSFHPVHLEDVTSTIQRPKIDEEENYIFLVFHIPQINFRSKKIESKEIDFFLTKNEVIAVIDDDFKPLDDLLDKFEKSRRLRREYFLLGAGFLLYRLIDELVDSMFPLLERFEDGLSAIDKEVFSKSPKNVAELISYLRRNIIFCKTLIKPELNSFINIETSKHSLMDKNLITYFSNITDHLKKIWDRLEDIQELTDNLSTTFESYITFKTNETIKILTIFSVVLLPLTLLSGIYGMNLSFLPLAEHPDAFFYLGLIMTSIILVMLAFFKSRHWI